MSGKCRPIVFTAESVRAILAGRKTQTRRVITPQPVKLGDCYDHPPGWLWPPGSEPGEDGARWPPDWNVATEAIGHCCPHGVAGDRLYVREAIDATCGCDATYTADDQRVVDGHPLGWVVWDGGHAFQRVGVIAARYMPRWASRITLEIIGVEAERLNVMAEEDAIAEGLHTLEEYVTLWNRLNAKRDYGWSTNPWVWVVEFRRIEGNLS